MSTEFNAQKKQAIWKEAAKGLGVLTLLVVLMMWLAGTFVDKVEPGPPAPRPEPPKVKTQKVELRVYPLTIDQVGTVRAQTEARVSSRVMAQVRELLVKEGDHVSGGSETGAQPTIMALLQDADMKARLHQAEARMDELERSQEAASAKLGAARAQVEAARARRDQTIADYRRYEDLRRSEAATGQQMEQAKAQKDTADANMSAAIQDARAAESDIKRIQAQREEAEAGFAEAHVMLGYTVIRAPFSGKVIRKLVDVGDMASPGQPLFLLDAAAQLELHAFLSESLLPRIHVGQAMEVHIDALNRSFSGVLREIVPKSDPSTRTVLIKVTLPRDPDLVNGLYGRLGVPYGKVDALVIPLKAVREVGQLSMVETVGFDGFPQRRFVILGQTHDDLVEVLSGLKENEEVVIP
jgi:multidrug resistance efflux pump